MPGTNTYRSRRTRRRLKTIVTMLIILALVAGFFYVRNLLTGSEQEAVDTAATNEELFDSFIERVNELEKKSQEYGDNKVITLNSGNLFAHIIYPEGDNDILNQNIKEWVDKTLYRYLEDSKESVSELSIHSTSYIIEEKYISVLLDGSYSNATYAHPEDIVKTFTVDSQTNQIVLLSDIYGEQQFQQIRNKVIADAKLDDDVVDEHLLDDFLFTDNGLTIYLKRGKYTPMSDGNVAIELTERFFKEHDATYYKPRNTKKNNVVNNEKIVVSEVVVDETIKDKKLIALTFDDGPSIYTERLLDILKQNDAKATFFVLGSQVSKYPETLVHIVQSGNEIGNHTWDHKDLCRLSEKDIEDEIMTTRTKMFNTAGVDALAIRAPYGSVNDSVKAVAKKFNMHFIHWSIDTLDWKTRDSDATYNAIMKNAGDGQIILCHDIHKQTVDAMDRVIKQLKSDGYEFVTVSELFKLREKGIEAGKVYFDAR